MAVAHHRALYSHGYMNPSTPSFTSTPVPSNSHGLCTPKPVFSSPIAQCYANDLGLTPHSTGGFNPDVRYMLDVQQGSPATRESSSSDRRKAFFGAPKTQACYDRFIPGAPKNLYERTTVRAHRPLLSPIAFSPPTDASDASDSTGDNSCNLSSADDQPEARDENRCAFPLPEENIVHDDIHWSNGSLWHSSHHNISNGRRSVSFKEGNPSFPSKPDVGPGLHPTILDRRRSVAGSKELRRSAGSQSLKRNGAPWVDQIVEATKRAGSYHADENATNVCVRPRLWLDPSTTEQTVAEAHVATVTRSPTKPRVIRIPHRSTITPPSEASSVSVHREQPWSNHKPVTPPETPKRSDGVDTAVAKPWWPVRQHRSSAGIDPAAAYPYTPPNSRVPSPRPRSTIRHVAALATDPRRRDAASTAPCATPGEDRNDRLDLIIGELEAVIHNYPTARLYLDSPVIQYIRLLLSAHPSSLQSPSPPSPPRVRLPHSRYSILHPLSSHPVTPEATPRYRSGHARSTAPSSQLPSSRSPSTSPTHSPVADMNATLSALRIIYPQAPAALLDSLQAAYLALNYISSLILPPHSRSDKLQAPPSPPASIRSFSSIPPKAPSFPPSTTSTSWLRSASPMAGHPDDDYADGTQKLSERREDLQISLRILVRGLLAEIEGRRLAKRDESLVRAVGEVVRCGENVSNGL